MTQKKTLSEQQQKFLDAMAGEAKGNVTRAKAIAGYSPNYANYHILKPLKEELLELAQDILTQNAPLAALSLAGVLDGESGLQARDKIAAAEKILDRVGIVKKEKIEVEATGASLFILPPKRTEQED